jgi:hypothetical protein
MILLPIPTYASYIAGITDMSHCIWPPRQILLLMVAIYDKSILEKVEANLVELENIILKIVRL